MTTHTHTLTTPKTRPIIFGAEMIRAILDGRKTQTRRVIKPQPPNGFDGAVPAMAHGYFWWKGFGPNGEEWPDGVFGLSCPYGSPGDMLWVRETWAKWDGGLEYFANTLTKYGAEDEDIKRCRLDYGVKWRPSIFMPRELSRITLEVTGVRVEQVQSISAADAEAEGVFRHLAEHSIDKVFHHKRADIAIARFRELWDSINARRGYSWDSNPWVWCVEFRRVTP